MLKPINVVVSALKDIAQGEGDLTVRLPLVGNNEVTNLSEYFNQTIEKIGTSIKIVGENSDEMTNTGSELVSNMTETASAVHEISANIDGVKKTGSYPGCQCKRNGCYRRRNYPNNKKS